MNKQKLFIFILLFIFLPFLTNQVKASDEWTDFSHVEITFENIYSQYNDYNFYDLLFNNVEFSNEINTNYYIFISNSEQKPTIGNTIEELKNNSIAIFNNTTEKRISSSKLRPFMIRKGNLYIWIVESKSENEIKEVLSAKEVIKPKIESQLGNRFDIKFNIQTISVLPNEALCDTNYVYMQIGEVTDNDTLWAIKEEEPDSLENLMLYAKEAEHPSYNTLQKQGICPIDKSNFIDIEEGAYYYVYLHTDAKSIENPEEFEIEEVEDISLFQGIYQELDFSDCGNMPLESGITLTNFSSNNFYWSSNITEPKPTVSVPTKPDTTNSVPTKPAITIPVSTELENKLVNTTPSKLLTTSDNTTSILVLPEAGPNKQILISLLITILILIAIIYYKKMKNIK